MTCELHDSYICLMMIKHAIPKIEWALNYYITQSRQEVRSWRLDELEDKMWLRKPGGGGPWGPDELGSREIADKM